MGIQSQDKLLFRSIPVEFQDAVTVIQERHRLTKDDTGRTRPCVAIDANAIAYKQINKPFGPAGCITFLSEELAKTGIDVLIVADAQDGVRHHSKRATVDRAAKRERNRIKGIQAKMELATVLRDNSEGNSIRNKTLQSQIRSMERQSSRSLPDDFTDCLKEFAGSYDNGNRGGISFLSSKLQADPEIAARAARKEVDAIFTTDSDFSMQIGPAGIGDLIIRHIEFQFKANKIGAVKFVTGQAAVASHVDEVLLSKLDTPVFPADATLTHRPKYPLFDGMKNHLLRALIAVALGSDAWPGGIRSFGPKAADDALKAIDNMYSDDDERNELFLSKLVEYAGCDVKDKSAILCFAQSLIYETSTVGYIHGPPRELYTYLEEFKDPSVTRIISNGPKVLECAGVNGNRHKFLEAEGTYSCSTCGVLLCRHCRFDDSAKAPDSEVKCMPCVRGLVAPGDAACLPTENKMRMAITERKIQVPADATYAEVLNLYEEYVEDSSLDVFCNPISEVKYPLCSPAVLHPSSSAIIRMKHVSMRDFGHLVRDEEISVQHIAELIHLIASLVDVDTTMIKNCATYRNILSKNIISFAENSRVHTGERLCKRAIRHAMDPACPDIIEGTVSLGVHNNKVCLIVSDKVLASMRKRVYNVTSAFSAEDLIASSCDCKSGTSKDDNQVGLRDLTDEQERRVLCTHGGTVPTKLMFLTYDGLAEHILIELRERIQSSDFEQQLSHNESTQLKRDIVLLLTASGRSSSVDETQQVSFLDMLKGVAVGTDMTKRSPGRPNVKDLGLLRDKQYQRPESKALSIVKREGKANPDLGERRDEASQPTDPMLLQREYVQAKNLVDAILLCISNDFALLVKINAKENKPIGLKLLDKRAAMSPYFDSNYATRHATISQLAAQMKVALTTGTNRRDLRSFSATNPRQGTTTESKSPSLLLAGCQKKGCSFRNCVHQSNKFIRVPVMPPELPPGASKQRQITRAKKLFKRREWLDRIGRSRLDLAADVRICDQHPMETKTWPIKVQVRDASGQVISTETVSARFEAPVPDGISKQAETISKGRGTDRKMYRALQDLGSENADILFGQQIVEMQDVSNRKHKLADINPAVRIAAGLDVHNDEKENAGRRRRHFESPVRKKTKATNEALRTEPVIQVRELVPREVRRRTGFRDLSDLLSYAAILCGGDIDLLTSTVSRLTWIEEWIFYFEMSYGRTTIRWEDYEKEYDTTQKPLRKIFHNKLELTLSCRRRWPMYASHAEDVEFRDPKWNRHFPPESGLRTVLHDNSNIGLPNPSDADLNRSLFSDYYDGTVAKGGVAVQLSGWQRNLDLATGAIGDSQYLKLVKIFEQQQRFANEDTSSPLSFLNILDKGYRSVLEALNHGQRCMQPAYADSDRQFRRDETLHSACVAVVRSGNERAVKQAKLSWLVKRGCIDQGWELSFVADIWLAWGFQVNFMYDTVL